jgi:hypothetical protein
MKAKTNVEVPDRLVIQSGLGLNKQKDIENFIQEINQIIEAVRNQDIASARAWKACPWFEKIVGAGRNNPETVNPKV